MIPSIAAIAFPLKSLLTPFGCISGFLSACGWSRTCWRLEGSLSPIRQFGCGRRNLGELSPMRSAAAPPVGSAINGTSMKPWLRSVEKKHWLWRAVDQDGFVLEVLVQSRRNAKAAKRLIRKLLKGQGREPRVMITDKLRSYDAAKRQIMPGVEHRSHKGLNNRAENSHQPVRRRERVMKRFKSPRHLQRFVSIHDPIANLFHIPRHDIPSSHHRELRSAAMNLWAKIARA